MATVYHISLFLHILSAIIWLGGMLFLALIVVPVVRKPEYQQFSGQLFHQTGLKFRFVGWICLGLFLVTGIFNLYYRVRDWNSLTSKRFWNGDFGETLLTKLLIFAIILIMSAVHDFYIGPKATELWQANPDSPQAKKLRKSASWFGRLNLLLGLLVVYLAIGMVRGI